MSSSRARLHVRTPDVPACIELLDAHRKVVASGIGELREQVPQGLYRLRVSTGAQADEQLISVDRGGYEDLNLPTKVVSAAPALGTHASHEFHADAAERLSRSPRRAFGKGARLVVFARNMAVEGSADYQRRLKASIPFHELSLLRLHTGRNTRTEPLASLAELAEGERNRGWVGACVDARPGSYVLRWSRSRSRSSAVWQNPQRVIDQAVHLTEGWTTLVFLANRPETGLMRANASVHMSRMEVGWRAYGPEVERRNLAGELVLSGLRRGRSFVGERTIDILLRGKFHDPMLGILGAHAMLLQPELKDRLLDVVMENLRRLVRGDHPDYQALCAMARERGHARWQPGPVEAPPMLVRSYRELVANDPRHPGLLIPGHAAERLAPRLRSESPWTTWIPLEEEEKRAAVGRARAETKRAASKAFAPDSPIAWHLDRAAGRGAPAAAAAVDLASPEARIVARWLDYASSSAHAPDLEGLAVDDIASMNGLPVATTARVLKALRDEFVSGDVRGLWKQARDAEPAATAKAPSASRTGEKRVSMKVVKKRTAKKATKKRATATKKRAASKPPRSPKRATKPPEKQAPKKRTTKKRASKKGKR